MSEYYYIMAEAKLNGTWYNIDPWLKKMDGTFEHQYLGWRSRSYVGILGEECRGANVDFKYLAPSTQEIIKDGYQFDRPQTDSIDEWIQAERLYIITGLDALRRRTEVYDYEGFVSKNAIRKFEMDSEETPEWLTGKEFAALPADAKDSYRYYQWNDPYDAKDFLKTILQRAQTQLYLFNDAIDWGIAAKLREANLDTEASEVRLVVRIL